MSPAAKKPSPGARRRVEKVKIVGGRMVRPTGGRSAAPSRRPAGGVRRPAGGVERRTCSRCGTSVRCVPGGLPSGWSIETRGRRVEYLCLLCLRSNLRAIESKLPEEWWE